MIVAYFLGFATSLVFEYRATKNITTPNPTPRWDYSLPSDQHFADTHLYRIHINIKPETTIKFGYTVNKLLGLE